MVVGDGSYPYGRRLCVQHKWSLQCFLLLGVVAGLLDIALILLDVLFALLALGAF